MVKMTPMLMLMLIVVNRLHHESMLQWLRMKCAVGQHFVMVVVVVVDP
jgi:hypothetical protein